MLVIAALWEAEAGRSKPNAKTLFLLKYKNELGVVACAYNPSYLGG